MKAFLAVTECFWMLPVSTFCVGTVLTYSVDMKGMRNGQKRSVCTSLSGSAQRGSAPLNGGGQRLSMCSVFVSFLEKHCKHVALCHTKGAGGNVYKWHIKKWNFSLIKINNSGGTEMNRGGSKIKYPESESWPWQIFTGRDSHVEINLQHWGIFIFRWR